MLFNSYDFLFGFLPMALLLHRLCLRLGVQAAMGFLVAVSLFFYGWWHPPYLALLLISMAFNYGLSRVTGDASRPDVLRGRLTGLGVAANLLLLGWYKYAGFFAENLNAVVGWPAVVPQIALPLAISFFTFQQISYLVDVRRGQAVSHRLLDYALFVTFFPQLVAGPIVHHREVFPQFAAGKGPQRLDLAVGLTIFIIGLGKKILLADPMSAWANEGFGILAGGYALSPLDAWTALLAYTFQLYFDFSGYSDMAIGLGRMFGIKLPINFDAPLRAESMSDLWRRWHITLSRFLRDYLYIPLGGNRKGEARRFLNAFLTMFLGGIWHGAGWTYVAWGTLHGVFLMINHGWVALFGPGSNSVLSRMSGRTLTFLAWIVALVSFRSRTIDDAFAMYQSLIGITPAEGYHLSGGALRWVLLGFFITQLLPTTQQWMRNYEPALGRMVDGRTGPSWLAWRPSVGWGVVLGAVFFFCVPFLDVAGQFIYWAF